MSSKARHVWLVVGLAVLFSTGCQEQVSDTGTQPRNIVIGTKETGGQQSKPTRSKKLSEQTRDEIQRRLVGTWQANDETKTAIGFDDKWRVSYIGKGFDAQEVDAELVEGKVTYKIDTSSDLPVLSIAHSKGAEGTSRQYKIKRLTKNEIDLARIEDGKEAEPVTFVRDPEARSVIDDEEEGDGDDAD